ncbi:hypothetical protein KRR38_25075 [Novosphingobium sp. G106]|uniref:hypothetical protein n=1 Tax=Novosphingobium sp. G106 TaxID=2849500 RepID=UPI001C2CF6D4|nr:hypothetical protein [Novosphingobium sp. G106]MBV1690861.1 hypothetical protein [Novosphingobium sp. G106]
MSILDFVSREQLNDLDEDPKVAFMELITMAQRTLEERTQNLDEEEATEWRRLEAIRYSFMNAMVGSAMRLKVEPFASLPIPHRNEFDYHEFKLDIDNFVTSTVLDTALQSRSDTVEILPKTKNTLRGYINGLRECIENANLTVSKREALLKRLAALEAELDKRRVNMMTIARVVFEIWAAPGAAWASYEVANKLLSNLMHGVAEAKEAEKGQLQLPVTEALKALSAPRLEIQSNGTWLTSSKSVGFPRDDLDGDLP